MYTHTYTKEASNLILREFQHLVGLTEGLFYVVATGSSVQLRALAFCQMKIEDAHAIGMIHYSRGRDLNSTKLRPMWMRPIVSPTELILAFLSRYNPRSNPMHVYISSGGLPGMMKDEGQQKRGHNYFVEVEAEDEFTCGELQALAKLVGPDWTGNGYDTVPSDKESAAAGSGAKVDGAASTKDASEQAVHVLAGALRFVPLGRIPHKLRSLDRWFDLADRGVVQLRADEVAFGSYLTYFHDGACRDDWSERDGTRGCTSHGGDTQR